MMTVARTLIFVGIALYGGPQLVAQTLAPRAYIITPKGANAITLSWSFYDGIKSDWSASSEDWLLN